MDERDNRVFRKRKPEEAAINPPIYALSPPSGGLLPQYSILIYFRPLLHCLGLERGWRCTPGEVGGVWEVEGLVRTRVSGTPTPHGYQFELTPTETSGNKTM